MNKEGGDDGSRELSKDSISSSASFLGVNVFASHFLRAAGEYDEGLIFLTGERCPVFIYGIPEITIEKEASVVSWKRIETTYVRISYIIGWD